MIIQGDDYKFEEVTDYSTLYDVSYLKTINKGKDSEKKRIRMYSLWSTFGYC